MNQLLKENIILKANISKQDVKIGKFLGGGGQGEVYEAVHKGDKIAVKWYNKDSATDFQKNILNNLISIGSPNNNFLWPSDLVFSEKIEGFGYIMPLRPTRFKSIIDLVKRKADPKFRELIKACYNLADSFKELHAKGFSYRDISFGNVFFDPKTGEILICDNDNVNYDDKGKSGILGTPSFMAPEIVRGEAKPSTNTDLFSLAVLLFYMLYISHPLDGEKEAKIKCKDMPALNDLYGFNPVYIFDPINDSNRPVNGIHDNAIIYNKIFPQKLKNLFEKAFTKGIKDPDCRVRESEWKECFRVMSDLIINCSCTAENFYDESKSNNDQFCWNCKKQLIIPAKITINKNIIILNKDTKIKVSHLSKSQDVNDTVASLNQHPQNPNIWGLKNESLSAWKITFPDGKESHVEPGRSCSITLGLKIDFGHVIGEIS